MHHVHRIDALPPGQPPSLFLCVTCNAVLSGTELDTDPGHSYVEPSADPCTIAGRRTCDA